MKHNQTKPTFTPGPWTADVHDCSFCEAYVRSADFGLIAKTGARDKDVDDNQKYSLSQEQQIAWDIDQANAALIAAAPEMYEAIGRIVDECTDLNFEQLCLLKDVLRKARGES